MNDQESYEFEGRRYVSPTLSSTEQDNFIDNLRNVQAQNNAQIAQQTHDLGTQVPSNLGGLGGGESYFNARYQTPQANEVVSTLKAAAQAQELKDAMNNYNAQLQNRYKQKYREYNKAQREYSMRKQRSGGNGGGTPINTPKTPNGNTSGWNGDVKKTVREEPRDTITDAPIEGHRTTSFFDGANFVVHDETTGEYYINGINKGKNPYKVTPRTATGGGSGGAW